MARRSAGALAVGAGIFLSRIFGLIRERTFAYYLGNSDAAGVFKAALRIPNLLQNLLGDGVLSASFVPIYTRLHSEGKVEEAARLASVVASVLALATGLLAALGSTCAPILVELTAPGFTGELRELAVTLVRILFSGSGLLVLSAWCVGVLNSHRRFFLSYVAPVLWNIAQIATLVAFGAIAARGRAGEFRLVNLCAWGMVVGAALQLAIQLPGALRLVGRLRPSLAVREPGPRRVLGSFVPVLFGRGVVQLSAYIDQILASYLGAPAVAAMMYAQQLYLLPVSLFGMAVSVSELTELSQKGIAPSEVTARVAAGAERIAFYVIPSVVAFLILGDVVVATLYQTGRFGAEDTRFVWLVLAGSTVGLLATTNGRLYASAFYGALGDARAPLRFAVVRVVITAVGGWALALPVRTHFGWPPAWGAAGLTASAGVAGWVEFLLLRRGLVARLGPIPSTKGAQLRGWAAALAAGGLAFGLRWLLPFAQPVAVGAVVLGAYGLVYLGLAQLLGLPEAGRLWARVRRRR